jgi:hypothetical protein
MNWLVRTIPVLVDIVQAILPSAATGLVRRSGGTPLSQEILGWLGDLDSNQGCPGQSREFYR